MKLRLISMATALIMLSSNTHSFAAGNTVAEVMNQVNSIFKVNGFKDTSTHWGKTYIEKLQREGYAVGNNGYFNPNQALKTEDFIIMVLKIVDPASKDLKASEGQAYFEPFMNRASEIGLTKGQYDEVPQYVGRMMPRELAVQVIDRALSLMGETITADHGLEYKFKDYAIVNDVNKEAVLKAYQLGIIKGTNGKFEPKNPLTRAESAVLVAKLLDKSLRDKLTFSKNTKTYDEASEWFLSQFEKLAGKRTVVIEKKADGSINNGDRDFLETRKWWTDQEFENRMCESINIPLPIDYANAMAGPSKPDFKSLSVQGDFYVHDGEIGFVNIPFQKDQSLKVYDAEINNLNRIVYDLMKYTSQYAQEHGTYARVFYDLDRIVISYQLTSDMMSDRFMTSIYFNKKDLRDRYDLTQDSNIVFDYNGFNWKEDEAYIKQVIHRIYGKEKGEKAFQFMRTNMKDRTVKSTGKFVKFNDGIYFELLDLASFGPAMHSLIK